MKRLTAILMALSLAFPAWAAAELDVNMEQKEENEQTLTVFSAAEAGAAETTAAPEKTPDPALATANGLIEARFEQAKAAQLTQRAGAEIIQSGETHTLGNVASLVLRWNGTQPDGTAGSAVRALALDRTTGGEIRMEQLFDDADAAIGAMERIIEDDVLPELSDYMEYSELLPMPRDAYAVDEYGLTVFYPDDSYRYFDEQSGAVRVARAGGVYRRKQPGIRGGACAGRHERAGRRGGGRQAAGADDAGGGGAEARRSAFSLHAADRSGLYEGFTGVSV